MEIGISTFGEISPDGKAGRALHAHQRVKELLEQIQLAEQVGLDVFALGEHHRPDYVISSPEVILAAVASRTQKIKLSSAVTVLSSADPVRVYQNFASLDLVSDGRAEIMVGRGSFIESFPLFGFDLRHYDELFEERLSLLLQINENEYVTWHGKHRPAIQNLGIYPRPIQERLPIWIAVGGTPESAIRAGKLNLPMTLAILGGPPDRFVPFATLHRQAAGEAGHDLNALPLAINVHFYLAEDSQQASDELYPTYARMMNKVGRERGWSPLTRDQFEYNRKVGPLLVGSPQQVVDKLLYMHGLFKNSRFLLQLISGGIDHKSLMRSIEILGTKVAPVVRKETGSGS